jgi:hypothetical protein
MHHAAQEEATEGVVFVTNYRLLFLVRVVVAVCVCVCLYV